MNNMTNGQGVKATIQPYIDNKLISEQTHPEFPNLAIYNYTQKCQFEKAWDDITKKCRGLIYDHNTQKIIARPFEKFFNIGEHRGSIPNEDPIIWEKYDGSLGILYWAGGKPWIATRGSFSSDQAQWATKWFRENVSHPEAHFNADWTYLFEIIYPENRIVVDYNFEGLVLLGAHDEDWVFKDPNGIITLGLIKQRKIKPATLWPSRSINELKELERDNAEGFVVHYAKSGLRLKYKFDEYVRLHRLVTQVTARSIWDLMRNGHPLDELLERVPDEFFEWVKEKQEQFNTQYKEILEEAQSVYEKVKDKDRKKAAQKIMKKHKDISSIIFARLDNKPFQDMIWKMIKPAHETPFKKEL